MTHRFNLRTFCIPATVVLMILVLASMCCASRIVDGDPNTIGAVLSQRDGTTVTLTGEQIIWCGKSGKSFAIKETFDKQPPLDNPRLVVVSTHSLAVEDDWTVDVTGVLSTMPSTSKDGGAITQRVLIVSPENVTVYCDSTGKAIFCPPVKALRMDWPTKRSLAQLSGTNTIQSASISAMDVGGLPVMDDSPDSESITPAEGSRDGLKWLPDGAKVHLKNRPVLQSNYLIFSIEEPDRTNSIRVCPTYGYSPSTGDLVEIYGTMATVDGERVVKLDTNETDYVDLLTVQDTGCTMPFPVGLPNKAAGGGALGSFTPAIGSSTGLNNTGMLATVWGKVTASSIV
ncbi:hypothetical protein LLG38_03130, partial [bacterium]|nr:hypothetical protein [bacterium]